MSTILKPVPMVRVAIIGLKKFRQQILTILHEMNVIHLEPLSKTTESFLARERESEFHNEISDQLLRIKGLLGSLPPTKIVGKSGFLSLNELISTLKSLDIDSKIASLEREKDNLTTQKREAENNIKLVEEFSFFHDDFDILNLSFARSYFGRVASDKFPEFRKELQSESLDIILYPKEADKITHFVLITTPTFRSASLASAVNSHNVHLEAVPKLKGKPEIIIQNQKNITNTLSSKLNQINNQMTEISRMHYKYLKGAEEQLEIENRKLEIIDHLGVTEDAFALEGWVPKPKIENLKTAFKKHTEGTILSDLESKENPPTLLATPKKMKVYESFIRFYSLPSGKEFDPTVMFALIFPFFYGMMIGDVGYGIVILLVSKWVIRRVEGGKRNFTIMPKFLRNFAKTILRPTQMVKLAKAIIPGCIFTIILGFCFNLYFGFHLNQYLFSFLNETFGFSLPPDGALLDPISTFGLRKLLLISGYIGLGMVSFGLVLGILNAVREGQKKHAIGKIGWLAFGWGISLLGLALIGHQNINPTGSMTGAVYFALILGGLGLMFYGEGVRAMMELPSIISHILSYTRIVGIMLASIILADVIDHIFLRTIDNPLPHVILGISIFFIGHIFNIVLGVFEPGIQGARLIYVEFFSKFYHGNGKPYKPFGRKRKFTFDQYNVETTTG